MLPAPLPTAEEMSVRMNNSAVFHGWTWHSAHSLPLPADKAAVFWIFAQSPSLPLSLSFIRFSRLLFIVCRARNVLLHYGRSVKGTDFAVLPPGRGRVPSDYE